MVRRLGRLDPDDQNIVKLSSRVLYVYRLGLISGASHRYVKTPFGNNRILEIAADSSAESFLTEYCLGARYLALSLYHSISPRLSTLSQRCVEEDKKI